MLLVVSTGTALVLLIFARRWIRSSPLRLTGAPRMTAGADRRARAPATRPNLLRSKSSVVYGLTHRGHPECDRVPGCSARSRPRPTAHRSGSAARRQRALLGLLLLARGRPVSVDTLTEELWHGAPPPGAAKTLRVYLSRLRSALADDAVIARPPGHALEVDVGRIDATRFETLLHEGREALARGAAGLAADRLGAALELWRGPALVRCCRRRNAGARGASPERASTRLPGGADRGGARSSAVTRSSSTTSSDSSRSSRFANGSGGSS